MIKSPCPFCGEEKDLEVKPLALGFVVRCYNCAAEGPSAPNHFQAEKLWNEREEATR